MSDQEKKTPTIHYSVVNANFNHNSAMSIQKDEKNRIILLIFDTYKHSYLF